MYDLNNTFENVYQNPCVLLISINICKKLYETK